MQNIDDILSRLDEIEGTDATEQEDTMAEEPKGSSDDMLIDEDNEIDDSQQVDIIKQHLDTLPDDDKEFLASHLSKEMAKIIGLISGNQVIEQYFESISNPDVALIPVPRGKAQEMLAKYQGMKEQGTQEAQTEQPPMMEGQAMGVPVGPMQPPMGPPA